MNFNRNDGGEQAGASTLRRLAVGVFYSRVSAEAAVSELLLAGFTNEQIGVVARRDEEDWAAAEHDTDSPAAGAATGAATGAVAGAGLGGLWALGIAAGMLPAIGPVVAGGILGSVLVSATAGAAAGGLVGGLIGFGLTEAEAQYYASEVTAGRAVVTVRAGRRYDEADAILRGHGAYDAQSSQSTASV